MSEETKNKKEHLERQIKAAKRLISIKKAKNSILDFTRLTMPSPEDPDNTDLSRYSAAKHHEVICAALEEVEAGRIQRLIITMPPRHGKSELASRRFPAWFLGKDPYRHMIFATYNDEFASDFGRHVRDTMKSDVFKQAFPLCKLKAGSQASDRISTEEGGIAVFVGRGGSLTGRGADLLVIDDPIKDREEADSKTLRDKLWGWFTDVAMTRLMTAGARVVIIMTRWHEDDLVGRLIDPKNSYYVPEEAANWKVLSLPAIAVDDDPMGRKNGEALWPERFDLDFLNQAKRLNPKGFSALYQGSPSPDDGDYFKREWLKFYMPSELPRNLRIYVSSDHAVSTDQERDATCLLPVGVDDEDNIWILPDVWWRRADTETVVEGMIDLMRRRSPLMWWAESGHITKSIGPFLRKRMSERSIYCAIDEVVPTKDKQTRAQSIRARMSMGKVFFPRFATWWPDAQDELMKFPSSSHDDFVDALAHIGMGLDKQVRAGGAVVKVDNVPKSGTLAWVKWADKFRKRNEGFLRMGGF
ncbi:Archaeophage PsiM2, terminase large subunit [uncultured Caudovirales phage]|uniref:Archaeophage PsiM2, terminase large subunit n=1 Tax=uncultured Caudovirales phage TaxID=2100421 RepID=A0A6J5MFS7_9CAUD|nr:Archaeophage PsiM2, terminase large subunit [uncultured Caudovirales phage]CAB4163239.1 Archaeophage PsiM2, terminase large subunit [uncultured Caudovirales phage]CAB4191510.1 Archaeophage PsiM2, terminase large subunit [uncultured Caudovirales phage]